MTDRECHWTASGILVMFSTNLELKEPKELVNGNVWPEEADGGKAKKCHRSYYGSFTSYLTGAGKVDAAKHAKRC